MVFLPSLYVPSYPNALSLSLHCAKIFLIVVIFIYLYIDDSDEWAQQKFSGRVIIRSKL